MATSGASSLYAPLTANGEKQAPPKGGPEDFWDEPLSGPFSPLAIAPWHPELQLVLKVSDMELDFGT